MTEGIKFTPDQTAEEAIEVPKFLLEIAEFTRTLDDKVKLIDLYNPPGSPEDPPPGWIERKAALEPNDRSALHALLGAASANGFEEVGSLSHLTPAEILQAVATREANGRKRFRPISQKRSIHLNVLFYKGKAE